MLIATFLVLLALVAVAAIAVATLRGRRLDEARDAVVTLARAWAEDGSSRGRLCAAAAHAAGARLALLAEATPRGDALRITATAEAPDVAGHVLALSETRSPIVRAFLRREAVHVADLDAVAEDGALLRAVGARSAAIHPVVHGDRDVGVLVVAWSRPREELDPQRGELVAALADEAARAVERDAHVNLLARQARTDELTALPNRRAWDEAVVREISRAERTGRPLCMALLDLDHFKAYNDAHGHQAGDAHLRRTAAAWRRELRAIDVLARYGGEEFGILLPDCDLAQAQEVLDRVRAATPNRQTASAGVVRWDGRETPDSLLARADAAMYRAKHAGRGVTIPA
ncbi:MAG TPA: sensor domain-containing diguanylate cyclase [Solirubrobacteraceae bacterium]|nr:sensor domain-containing diguanylate cyclase [Solirubrobacteraceae bacterium]